MVIQKRICKTLDELVAEYKAIAAKADELQRQMKELNRQIKSVRKKSSHEIEIPNPNA